MNVQATVDKGLVGVIDKLEPLNQESRLELLQTIIKKCPYHFEVIGLWFDPNKHPLEAVSKMTHFMGTLPECLTQQTELHANHWPQPIE